MRLSTSRLADPDSIFFSLLVLHSFDTSFDRKDKFTCLFFLFVYIHDSACLYMISIDSLTYYSSEKLLYA